MCFGAEQIVSSVGPWGGSDGRKRSMDGDMIVIFICEATLIISFPAQNIYEYIIS